MELQPAKPELNLRASVALLVVACCLSPLGCTSPTRQWYEPRRYTIDLHLSPSEHAIRSTTAIDLVRVDDGKQTGPGPATFDLLLHRELKITGLRSSGATVLRHATVPDETRPTAPAEGHEESSPDPARHRIVLDRPAETMTLFVEYEGALFQDVSAGEKPGEIHNFVMSAHVSAEGIYLAGGCWYPSPDRADDAAPAGIDFVVSANKPDGIELVASGEPVPSPHDPAGRLRWQSPYPLDAFTVVGGPLVVHRDRYRDIDIALYLSEANEGQAPGLTAAVKRYLDRYEPLIGPYPAKTYTVVENFFSSGFAFPMFTLLSGDVIAMGERAQTAHGYIDHEILHSWWGNGVFVDARDGNWCESLASYAANYYGYILDGDEEGARRTRRNYGHFLSTIKPENDKPLDTYGKEDGCSRGIAYNKGAMVFHMLARRMGQERFWAAMRAMTAQHIGRHVNWKDIQTLCEKEHGESLDVFFGQWVRGSGAPQPSIVSATHLAEAGALTLVVDRGAGQFELDLPVRLVTGGTAVDSVLPLPAGTGEVTVRATVPAAPDSVLLDPDYHLFRRVPADFIIPTTARTRSGKAFASVVGSGQPAAAYEQIRETFEGSFKEDQRIRLSAGSIEPGALADRNVLILGEAVRDVYVSNFLSAIEFPVAFGDSGFIFDGVEYADPAHGLLVTVRHPDMPGGGITVVYANSEAAVPGAISIPFYDRSLVIFKDRQPIVRHDFERAQETVVDKR